MAKDYLHTIEENKSDYTPMKNQPNSIIQTEIKRLE